MDITYILYGIGGVVAVAFISVLIFVLKQDTPTEFPKGEDVDDLSKHTASHDTMSGPPNTNF